MDIPHRSFPNPPPLFSCFWNSYDLHRGRRPSVILCLEVQLRTHIHKFQAHSNIHVNSQPEQLNSAAADDSTFVLGHHVALWRRIMCFTSRYRYHALMPLILNTPRHQHEPAQLFTGRGLKTYSLGHKA